MWPALPETASDEALRDALNELSRSVGGVTTVTDGVLTAFQKSSRQGERRAALGRSHAALAALLQSPAAWP